MMWWTSFSVKEGVKPEKRGFQPMRKKLGEKFGVVFSFAVVVTDTELFLKFLEDTGVVTRTWMLGPRMEERDGFG